MTVHDFHGQPSPAHTRCWVRVRRERPDGFVEFDFAIGDPDLSVDLILPRPAFDEFCAVNRVRLIDDAQARRLDEEQARWRYGQPGVHE